MVQQLETSIQTNQQTLNNNTCVIIFAKYPASGMAKTRLQPALGIDGTARMARKLLLHSIEQAMAAGFVVNLCVSPAPTDPCWQVLDLPNTLQWSGQVAGDLGTRLLTASQQALNQYQKVLLIGTDCPSLTAQRIQVAAQQLDRTDAVMIPASDGGYVLLGLTTVHENIFSNITWSTSSVAAVTQQRVEALGWSLAVLEPLHDIDEPADLKHLPSGWLDGYTVAINR